MNITKFKNIFLKNIELIGEKSHIKLLPKNSLYYRNEEYSVFNPRISAVTILIFEQNNRLLFALIQRKIYNGNHSGQISFPGGKYEEQDIQIKNTAIRETSEEIGIHENNINIIFELSPVYIKISNFLVYPFIALLERNQEFKIDEREVEKLILIELSDFLNAEIQELPVNTKNNIILAPCIKIQNNKIWGATAMILQEFKELIIKYK